MPHCTVYQQGKEPATIKAHDIHEHLMRPDCFVWAALSEAEPSKLEFFRQEFHLHELAIDDAQHGHQRPKIEEYGDSLFVVVHMVELFGLELYMGEIDIFVGKNYVLSVRARIRQKLLSDVQQRCENEPHLLKRGPAFVLFALLDVIVDRYFPIIDQLESELETIEENIFVKGAERSNIESLYQLKRRMLTLKHAVSPLMGAIDKLYGAQVPAICANMQEYFRDIHDRLHHINASIDAVRDTISTAIQVNLSLIAIDENEVNKRLAAWAAIFAVTTAFSGIWGMNFSMMPELSWKYGYPVALVTICSIAGFLYYRFRRSGWL